MANEDPPPKREVPPAPKEAPPAKKRRTRAFHVVRQVLIVLLVLAVLPGIYFYFRETDYAPSPIAQSDPVEPLAVDVRVMEPRDVPREARYLAQTEASQLVPIRARVSGYLMERSFEEGQRVRKDQLLFRIDPESFEVALAQAEAQLTASQARLQRAERQLQRVQRLAERQAASADELEQWQEEQQVAAADVQLQRARISQVQLDLDYTTIRSPIAGMIGESQQDVGSYISPAGDSLLATVRQVDPMYVRFSVSEQDLLRWERWVRAGIVTDIPVEQMEVEVIFPDGGAYPHVGRINYIDVAINPSTGTAVVRATVPNPDSALRPGQFVTAKVTGAHRIGAFLVPQSAVIQSPEGTHVYVIDADGRAQLRLVEPGEWHGDQWIINAGLQAGDRVILNRLMQLRPGTSVRVDPGNDATVAGESGPAESPP